MANAGELIEKTLAEHQIRIHPAVMQVGVPHVTLEILNALRACARKAKADKFPFPNNKLVKDKSGRLIDGRARCAAMLLEERKPKDADWSVIEISDERVKLRILRTNLIRRHLTSSQRAMLIAKQIESSPRKMMEELKEIGTSAQSVELAQRVLRSKDKELIERILSGKITVSRAVKFLRDSTTLEGVDFEAYDHRSNEPEGQGDDDGDEASSESKSARLVSGVGSKSRKRGRPPGDPTVRAWDRAWGEFGKIADNLKTLKKKWRPTRTVLSARRRHLKGIQDVLTSAKVRRDP